MKNLVRTALSSGLAIGLSALLISDDAHGADRLIVKDGLGVSTFVVTDIGATGVGTASPAQQLHVFGTVSTGIQIETSGANNVFLNFMSNGVQKGILGYKNSSGAFVFGHAEAGAGLASAALAIKEANVGIGTASPEGKFHVSGFGTQLSIFQSADDGAVQLRLKTNSTNRRIVALNNSSIVQSQIVFNDNGAFDFFGPTNADKRLSIPATGVLNCSAGIKTDANGLLSCMTSSRHTKNVEGDLAPLAALTNVMALRPQVGSYKVTPNEPEHWLIAEEVAAVDPALVGMRDGKPYTVKTQNVIADLIAVIQEQQRGIEEQKRGIEQQQRRVEQQQSRIEALERAIAR